MPAHERDPADRGDRRARQLDGELGRADRRRPHARARRRPPPRRPRHHRRAGDAAARQHAPRGPADAAKQHVQSAAALTDAAYGAGLLNAREHDAASELRDLARQTSRRASSSRRSCARRSACRRVGAGQHRARLRRGDGRVDVPPARVGRHPRRRAARLAADPLRRGRGRLDDFVAGGDRPKHASSARPSRRRARAQPGPRVRSPARRRQGPRLRPRRDRRAHRDARRPRAGGRHPDAGRGQRALARAAPGARARHPERRRSAPTPSIGSASRRRRPSSSSPPRAAASSSRTTTIDPEERRAYRVHPQPDAQRRRRARRAAAQAPHRPRQARPRPEAADRSRKSAARTPASSAGRRRRTSAS